MAESIRPHPDLDRFYSACIEFAMEWYRDLSTYPLGEQLVPVAARPTQLDSMEKLWHFSYFFLNAVRVIADLEERAMFTNENFQERLQEEQQLAVQDIADYV